MANIKSVNLEELHQAIKTRLEANFPGVYVFADYKRFEKSVPTPSILIELMDMPTGDPSDMGTGQYHADLIFEAKCICRNLDGKGAIAARSLALALSAYIHLTKWGVKAEDGSEAGIQPVDPARVVGSFPDVWEPDIDSYEVFRVEWEHSAYAGVDVWDTARWIPSSVEIEESVTPPIQPPLNPDPVLDPDTGEPLPPIPPVPPPAQTPVYLTDETGFTLQLEDGSGLEQNIRPA